MRIQSLFVKTEMLKDLCLFNATLVDTKELYKRKLHKTGIKYSFMLLKCSLGLVSKIGCTVLVFPQPSSLTVDKLDKFSVAF